MIVRTLCIFERHLYLSNYNSEWVRTIGKKLHIFALRETASTVKFVQKYRYFPRGLHAGLFRRRTISLPCSRIFSSFLPAPISLIAIFPSFANLFGDLRYWPHISFAHKCSRHFVKSRSDHFLFLHM
jgi:hypothetical protein